jgi:hypothetical protein
MAGEASSRLARTPIPHYQFDFQERDPPTVSDDSGKKMLMNVIARLLPDEPSPKDVKVNPTRAAEMIEMYTNTSWLNLDEDLCIRLFSWC